MKREVARREIESLDYYLQNHTDDYSEESHTAMMMAISALSDYDKMQKISLDLAFENDELMNKSRWIPTTERLPKEPYACWVTVWDTNILTQEEFENILPYPIGYDGETWNDWEGNTCPFEVIAWMPLPEPYKAEKGGE